MKSNLFKKKPIHLYDDLKPGARIDKLLVDFLAAILEPEGFKYLKSKREFKKRGEFFDFHLGWRGRKYNEGKRTVKFDISINSFSPKYRKWETQYYQLNENWGNAVDGTRVDYIDGWDKEYYDLGWYDLVKYDNIKLMEKVVENTKVAGFTFFQNYTSLDSAITKLKKYPIANLEKIVDFYILQDKWKEAFEFFEENKGWHEEEEKLEGSDPNSQYSMNRRMPFEKRKDKLNNWLQQRI
ncbi:hypothetical protein [Ulvibacter antarcticus]|uniref:DUF4304 domain-containing protein n=1 Tax=Ulvibacter antarcticus TaxID=442714 RepID=A0A3L9Y6H0_9FLAO|nr:hypothetical protein [Ulvibacter antarcticus]RMA56303.1 hypothetical protein BXY75_3425 [Ulvibacter antarcticus]